MTEAQRLAEWLDANSSSEEFQRVAERVAYLRRLEAECEQLREDAGRLDWLLWKLPGDSIRYCVGEISDNIDGAEFRTAIDKAMKETK